MPHKSDYAMAGKKLVGSLVFSLGVIKIAEIAFNRRFI